jgi:SAM-dependent methyltransferase
MSDRLNLGCGRDIRSGWINLDVAALPGVDVVHDLNQVPLPFATDTFTLIDCKDVLEHVDFIRVLRDLHRVLRTAGTIRGQVPHFTSKDAFSDPTHRNFFTSHTLRYFTSLHPRNYYFDFSFSSLSVRLHFDCRPAYPYNYVLERLTNRSERWLNVYEGSPLRVFPATNIAFVLVK